jgi:glycosyltransferase involved in cell wall biosynthesis
MVRTESHGPVRVAIVTNIPTPYRVPVYERLAGEIDVDLTVFYFSALEPNRYWKIPATNVRSVTLRGCILTFGGRYIHVTRGLVRGLLRAKPQVIITTGYNPGHLIAFVYAVVFRIAHVVQTDGTVQSEARLGPIHRKLRRFIAARSEAFVAASEGGLVLLHSFGAPQTRVFKSVLAVDNSAFAAVNTERPLDLLFAGQLTETKNPLFALRVASGLAETLGRSVTLAFVGAGAMQPELEAIARSLSAVEVTFSGFVQQSDLPNWYLKACILLFPTKWDPWGLVANEASAAGVPVLVSPNAGCANELVEHGVSGFVIDLEIDQWVEAAATLLRDRTQWSRMSAASRQAARSFTFEAASEGLHRAVLAASGRV